MPLDDFDLERCASNIEVLRYCKKISHLIVQNARFAKRNREQCQRLAVAVKEELLPTLEKLTTFDNVFALTVGGDAIDKAKDFVDRAKALIDRQDEAPSFLVRVCGCLAGGEDHDQMVAMHRDLEECAKRLVSAVPAEGAPPAITGDTEVLQAWRAWSLRLKYLWKDHAWADVASWDGITVATEGPSKGRVVAIVLQDGIEVEGQKWFNRMLEDEPLPDGLWRLTALEHLELKNCGFKGSLPPALGQLTSLRHLVLEQNYICGRLPKEIGELGALEVLNLKGNGFEVGQSRIPGVRVDSLKPYLSHDIPKELGNCSALVSLILDGNDWKGLIPATLGNLKSLVRLSIDGSGGCGIEGAIPPELGQCEALQHLCLKDTGVDHEIPSEFAKLKSLKTLDLRGNYLSGSVPQSFEELMRLEVLLIGDNTDIQETDVIQVLRDRGVDVSTAAWTPPGRDREEEEWNRVRRKTYGLWG